MKCREREIIESFYTNVLYIYKRYIIYYKKYLIKEFVLKQVRKDYNFKKSIV